MSISMTRVFHSMAGFAPSRKSSAKLTGKPPYAEAPSELEAGAGDGDVAVSEAIGWVEDLRAQERITADDIDSLFTLLRAHVSRFELQDARRDFSQILTMRKFHFTLKEVTERCARSTSPRPTYCIGAGVLHETFQRQVGINTEAINIAVGHRHGHLFTVERVVPVALDLSTVGRAVANRRALHNVLIEAGQYGGLFTCHFHTHPGYGLDGNLPSNLDHVAQRLFEQGGYATIGGIFSRDGFLRFFSEANPFTISISGKGIGHVGQNIFKLTSVPDGSLQEPAPNQI